MSTATIDGERLMTNEEAAELLQVTPGTLNTWRCTRRYLIPYVKVGRRVRYRLRDLLAWIESRVDSGI